MDPKRANEMAGVIYDDMGHCRKCGQMATFCIEIITPLSSAGNENTGATAC